MITKNDIKRGEISQLKTRSLRHTHCLVQAVLLKPAGAQGSQESEGPLAAQVNYYENVQEHKDCQDHKDRWGRKCIIAKTCRSTRSQRTSRDASELLLKLAGAQGRLAAQVSYY